MRRDDNQRKWCTKSDRRYYRAPQTVKREKQPTKKDFRGIHVTSFSISFRQRYFKNVQYEILRFNRILLEFYNTRYRIFFNILGQLASKKII